MDRLEEFYENQQKPWWYYRCTHRDHAYWYDFEGEEYGCLRTLKEAEHAVVLQLLCLPQVHVLVELPGAGSVCKTFTEAQFKALTEDELMKFVQSQVRDLRALL